MRVRVERSGGFANIQGSVSADSDRLPADAAEELRRLVGEVEMDGRADADAYQYHLIVEHDDGSVVTGIASDSEAAATLFATIQTYS